ncbi:apolipoprotein D isoform X2 [Bactrocera dorsalis]|uniref:Apolipoprotein D isoform X1 n=1 Tax=Bactrocera dorsalis TaxID=27457 RepID=A0ABM3J0H7_BACDO|nr:apolipoprotein D isoform X1 [Bactrocera dorsalis]XP_049302740.1 apolipoprotein D isoform X2 [Bactrocera dorsalis]
MQKQQLICVYLSLIVLVSAKMVAGQVVKVGPCPSGIETVQDFDAEAYLGVWYEYSKYPFVFEAGGKCVQAVYGALTNDSVSVLNSQLSTFNEKSSISGVAKIVGPGKLSVRFNGVASLAGSANYWVLGTDYDNYAVVYSCKNLIIAHAETVWILTRERDPSEDIVREAQDVLVSQGVSLDPLIVTDQSGCPDSK